MKHFYPPSLLVAPLRKALNVISLFKRGRSVSGNSWASFYNALIALNKNKPSVAVAPPEGGQEGQVAPPLLFCAVFPVRANPLRKFFQGYTPRPP